MTPKQKLINIFKKHDYMEEHKRYVAAHTSNPVYYPSFEKWLLSSEPVSDILEKAIAEAGYKNPNSDRTWITVTQVYTQVGKLKTANLRDY